MKNEHRLLIYALLVSSAALLTIIICAHQFRWGQYLPERNVTPKEMVRILKKSNVSVVYVFVGHVNNLPPPLRADIRIQTKLGSWYRLVEWRPIPGTDYENTTDAPNLVRQILETERGLDSDKDFMLLLGRTP